MRRFELLSADLGGWSTRSGQVSRLVARSDRRDLRLRVSAGLRPASPGVERWSRSAAPRERVDAAMLRQRLADSQPFYPRRYAVTVVEDPYLGAPQCRQDRNAPRDTPTEGSNEPHLHK